jgi:histidine phosphotransfer protein HptB
MIDWKRIVELREEIGADGFVEVVDMFLDEAEGAVNALVAGLPPGEIAAQLHFLKGSALNLGLSDLAAICLEGERGPASGAAGQFEPAQVAAVFQTSRANLLSWLASDAVAGAA